MNAFNNLRVGTKMIGSFMVVALIIVVVAVVSYNGMKSVDTELEGIYTDNLQQISWLGKVNTAIYTLRGDIYKAVVMPDKLDEIEPIIAASTAEVSKEMDLLRAAQLSQEEKAEVGKFDTAWLDYQQAVPDLLAQVKAGNQEGVRQALADTGTLVKSRKAMGEAIDNLEAIQDKNVIEAKARADATQANANRLLIITGVISVLLAIGLGIFSSRAITVPLDKVGRAATGIAEGDLNQILDIQSRDEMGQMAQAFRRMIDYLQGMANAAGKIADGDLTQNVTPFSDRDVLGNTFAQMIANLRNLIGQVADNANNVGAASTQMATAANQAGQATSQIATTIQQVAKGTAQQTEGVTRTASSVEQMKRAIDGVAKGAQEQAAAVGKASIVTSQITSAIQQVQAIAQADAQGSAQAAQEARAGAQTVAETIKGMETIKAKVGVSAAKVKEMGQHSDQIGTIVETIDDIASQTNLLALNAAIEAARAGEHGKGFAVVADEVRKLAEKSTGATKEIADLIKGIQQTVSEAVTAMNESANEVETGVGKANESGQALASILEAVEAVQQGAAEAAATVQKMNTSANELVSAMDSVSAVVEENTAATEEMAAGSAEVMQAMENIASVSEENSAAVEEVSASAEEMSAQVEEVTASAQSLAEMAQALQQVVNQFRLSAEPLPIKKEPTGQKPVLLQTSVPYAVHGNNGRSPVKAL